MTAFLLYLGAGLLALSCLPLSRSRDTREARLERVLREFERSRLTGEAYLMDREEG